MPGKKRAAAPAEEEETFVRGGGSGLAPVEYKRLQKVRLQPSHCYPPLPTGYVTKCICMYFACTINWPPPHQLSAASLQEAYAEAEADLFRGSKKRRKPQAGEEDEEEDGDEEDAFFSSLSAQDKLPKYAELLKFKVSAACAPSKRRCHCQ